MKHLIIESILLLMKVVMDCVGALNKWSSFFSVNINIVQKEVLFATRVSQGPESGVGLFLHISSQFPESRRLLVTARPGSAAAWEL